MASGNRHHVVVGLGEILWDLLPEGKQLGGAPANFAYHAHALGAQAYPVSCVGHDALGQEILDRLEVLGLDTRYVAVDPHHPTGTVDVKLDRDGQPRFTIHENVAWDFVPFTPPLSELAARADAVCFGTLAQRCEVSGGTIRSFLDATRPDCLRVFDINLRQSYFDEPTVRALLASSNVVKLNDEELPVVARLLSIEGAESDCLEELLTRYHLRLVVLTRGARGSLLRAPGAVSIHGGSPVDVADTVGAGDAFAAATAMGLLRGHDLNRINKFANAVASHVCSRPGATPEIPAALRRRLDGPDACPAQWETP